MPRFGIGSLAAPVRRVGIAVATTVWFGLVAGLIDLGLTLARVYFLQHGLYRNKGPHLIWMIPVSSTAIFVMLGLLVGLGAQVFPRRGRQLEFFAASLLATFAVILAVPGIRAAACLILALGAASWLGPWLAARAERVQAVTWRTLPVLIAAVLTLSIWSFGRDWLAERGAVERRPATAPAGAPNVLLVVMDTVRADATSLYGEPSNDTTPGLARLARRGVLFERAISAAPWTLPSHASLFTGLWPWQLEVGIDRPLGPGPVTLAERFRDGGYATAGFVANTVFCSQEYGLGRGFEHYEDYVITPAEVLRSSSLGWLIASRVANRLLDRVLPLLGRPPRHPFEADVRRKDAAEIAGAALSWIGRGEPGRPFFAFLNLMDAHDPYLLPPGVPWRFARPSTPADYRLLKGWAKLDKARLTPDERALARAAYDDGIAYVDEHIGRLLDELDRRGMLENTVVVVTSDHGESFGRHLRSGEPIFGHAMSLYQAEIRVPLLIVAPGRVPAGSKVDRPVSLRDLPATLVELAGLANDQRAPLPGISLAGTWGGRPEASPVPSAILSESALLSHLPHDRRYREPSPGMMRAVIAADLSYHRVGLDREELYHLAEDPGEQRDLAGTPEAELLLQEMRGLLDELAPATR